MKTSLKTFLAVAAFGASALFLQAQPAPKILVIDLAKLYDGHYKTEEQNNKLRGDEQKAQEELDRLNKEGNSLVEQYKEMAEQAKNPALTAEARTKAESDAEKKLEEIKSKQNEVQNFKVNTQRSLQQRVKNFRDLLLEEISKTATDIAKKKGATLLLDKSGPSLIGVSSVVYADPSYEITDEVAAELNKGRPAGSSADAGKSAAPAGSPTVTFPGAKK